MKWKQCKNDVEAMQEWRGSNVRMAWKQCKNGVEAMQECGGQLTLDYIHYKLITASQIPHTYN